MALGQENHIDSHHRYPQLGIDFHLDANKLNRFYPLLLALMN